MYKRVYLSQVTYMYKTFLAVNFLHNVHMECYKRNAKKLRREIHCNSIKRIDFLIKIDDIQ